ncbi:MAG: agglutination protein, partial [Epsilonproteobacteria bacterium]
SGFDTVYGVEEQEALILSAGNSVEESANNLALETTTAYLNVLKTLTLYNIAQENVSVHDKYLQQIKEKVDAGLVRSSDYEQTLSRYESAKSSQYATQQSYLLAIYGLDRILPGLNTLNFEDPSQFTEVSSLSADNLVEVAMQNNPTIKISKSDIEAAKSAVDRASAAYYPTADIVLDAYMNENVHGLGYSTVTQENDGESRDNGYSGMLVLNYNIFNGFADSANKQANQHIVLQQQATLADSKLFISANTKMAWATYDMTKKQLVYINKNIKASEKTVSDYQQEHELGRRSIIDLLNIELEHNNARNRYTNTKYDNLTAYYQILSHTGRMLKEMNVIVK